ncbi:MAG: DUF4468 domain-containing protein [Bacteroidetes bacterium]|nr:DUF4468 domain-containing protein [Bacteroidota bacterium]
MRAMLVTTLLLLSFHFNTWAQVNRVPSLPLKGSDIRYEEKVAPGSGYDKDKLFNNAEEWFNKHYETADTKLTIDNKATGIVAGVASSNNDKQHKDNVIFFHFSIIVDSEAYTYSIDSIYATTAKDKFLYADMYREERFPQGKPRWTKDERYAMLTEMNRYINGVIKELKTDMMKR